MSDMINGRPACGLDGATRLYSGLVMLPHTVFALPFALTAVVLASYQTEISLPLLLSPLALAVVFFYSYTKYFTSFSHLVLGLALSIAPVGAYIAVTGG